MFQVRVNSGRPDFRIFIDLLYERGREVDTSGNCRHPEDTAWTDRYIKDRQSERPHLNVWIPEQYWDEVEICRDFVFHVKSDDAISEEAAAIFLFDYCGESIAENGRSLNAAECGLLRDWHAKLILRANRSAYYTAPNSNA